MTSATDWNAWHGEYDDPASSLSERLLVVQTHIDEFLEATAPSPVTVTSSCAGDGRDLLQVLERRGDASRVSAILLEADPRIADRAARHATRLDLASVEVRCTDAGNSDAYSDAVPADLVLLCGIFGNISDDDVYRTITAAPQFCNRNGLVVWTRHRREPDLTPRIREWFRDQGFSEEAFVAPAHATYTVGAQRFRGDPVPLRGGQRLFTFVK